jgi:hypothetical protein
MTNHERHFKKVVDEIKSFSDIEKELVLSAYSLATTREQHEQMFKKTKQHDKPKNNGENHSDQGN